MDSVLLMVYNLEHPLPLTSLFILSLGFSRPAFHVPSSPLRKNTVSFIEHPPERTLFRSLLPLLHPAEERFISTAPISLPFSICRSVSSYFRSFDRYEDRPRCIPLYKSPSGVNGEEEGRERMRSGASRNRAQVRLLDRPFRRCNLFVCNSNALSSSTSC